MAIDISQYKNAVVIDHPLLKHKITQLRDKTTGTNQFKLLVKESAFDYCVEADSAYAHLLADDCRMNEVYLHFVAG